MRFGIALLAALVCFGFGGSASDAEEDITQVADLLMVCNTFQHMSEIALAPTRELYEKRFQALNTPKGLNGADCGFRWVPKNTPRATFWAYQSVPRDNFHVDAIILQMQFPSGAVVFARSEVLSPWR